MRLAWLLLAACGGHTAVSPDADQPQPCQATFTGNFMEQSNALANCPMVDATGKLGFAIPSTTLGTNLAISIDLGPTPSPGTFSSETIASWSVLALQQVGTGNCAFSAGNAEVPTGSFTLPLDAVALGGAAHGTLGVIAYVLALVGTDCGAGDTETIEVAF